MSDPAAGPAIILVRPQMGENIGAAARAMMNFGLRDLRLVAPRDGWPNPKALEMAAHGECIVQQAQVFETLGLALADRHLALASTARPRTLSLPVYRPEEGAAQLRSAEAGGQRGSLVFGPERSGLENDDLAHCHGIITIPTDERNASLNIAQSVVLLAYAWFNAAEIPAKDGTEMPASLEEVGGLFGQLAEALEARSYFRIEAKRITMMRALQSMLVKAKWNAHEVRTLRGVIRALEGKKGGN